MASDPRPLGLALLALAATGCIQRTVTKPAMASVVAGSQPGSAGGMAVGSDGTTAGGGGGGPTGAAAGGKVGRSTACNFLQIAAWGDATTSAAARAGGITRVASVSYESLGVYIPVLELFLWEQSDTIVRGE